MQAAWILADNLAYIANQFSGLQLVNITDPVSPTLQGKLAIHNQSFQNVQVIDDLAYVAYSEMSGGMAPTFTGGLHIIDVSDPLSPTLRGTFDVGTDVYDAQVDGDYAYIAGQDTFTMLDVSDPEHPQPLDELELTAEPRGIHISGGRIYVAGAFGLLILANSTELIASTTITADGGQLTSPDGNLHLDFPTGAVSDTVTITYTSLLAPTQPLPADWALVQSFQLEARTSDGQPLTQLAQPLRW